MSAIRTPKIAIIWALSLALAFPVTSHASLITECIARVMNRISPNAEFAVYRSSLSPERQRAFDLNRRMQSDLVNRLRDAVNPASTASRMNSLSTDNRVSAQVIDKMVAFSEVVHARESADRIAERLEAWITTPVEALYVYQNLKAFASKRQAILDHLLTNEPLFSGTQRAPRAPHSLLEYAFEKETDQDSELVPLLWRPAGIPESDWFGFSEIERHKKLEMALYNSDQVVPTSRQTTYLGKLGYDQLGPFEFKHGSYEIQFSELQKQILFASNTLDETSGFHIHQVFYVPTKRQANEKFRVWYKIKSDELTLSGLEEGLHPSRLVSVAPKPEHIDFINFISLGEWTYKMHTIGLRHGLYGASEYSGMSKIGLEYRDASRNLPFLFDRIEQNAREIEAQVWDRPAFPGLREMDSHDFYLEKAGINTDYSSAELSRDFVRRIAIIPLTDLPLKDIENSVFYHTASQMGRTPTTQELERWRVAKESYIRNLRDLQNQIAGARVPDDRFKRAIQAILTQWAKEARPTLLYSPAP